MDSKQVLALESDLMEPISQVPYELDQSDADYLKQVIRQSEEQTAAPQDKKRLFDIMDAIKEYTVINQNQLGGSHFRKGQNAMNVKVQERIDSGALPEYFDSLSHYDFVQMNSGDIYLVDTSDHTPLGLKDEEVFNKARERLDDRFDQMELVAHKYTQDPKAYKRELERIDRLRKDWLGGHKDILGRPMKSRLELGRDNKNDEVEKLSRTVGRPVLYLSKDGIGYFGDKEDTMRRLAEFGNLTAALAATEEPYARLFNRHLRYISDGIESGYVPDFNPGLLGVTLDDYLMNGIARFSPQGDSEKSGSGLKKVLGSLLVALVAGTVAYGVYQMRNRPVPDTKDPEIISVDYDDSIEEGEPQIVKVVAQDNEGGSGMADVTLEVTPPGHDAYNVTMSPPADAEGPYTHNMTDTSVPGDYSMRVFAKDNAGLIDVEKGTFRVREKVVPFIEKYMEEATRVGVEEETAKTIYDRIMYYEDTWNPKEELAMEVLEAMEDLGLSKLTPRQITYLNNETDYTGGNLVENVRPVVLRYTFDTIQANPSINKGYAQELGHWLTRMLEEYPEAKDSWYDMNSYGKQVRDLFEGFIGVNYLDPEIIGLCVDNLRLKDSWYEKGEHAVFFVGDGWINNQTEEVRDNLMRQNILPVGLFQIDADTRDYGWKNMNKRIYLNLMRKNLDYANKTGYDDVLNMYMNEDSMDRKKTEEWVKLGTEVMTDGDNWKFEPWILHYRDIVSQRGTVENLGSLILGYSDYSAIQKYASTESTRESWVELGQIYGWRMGLPIFRYVGGYPTNPAGHQEGGIPISDGIMSEFLNNPEVFGTPMIHKNTNTMSIYFPCKEALENSNVPYLFIRLPSYIDKEYLFGNER